MSHRGGSHKVVTKSRGELHCGRSRGPVPRSRSARHRRAPVCRVPRSHARSPFPGSVLRRRPRAALRPARGPRPPVTAPPDGPGPGPRRRRLRPAGGPHPPSPPPGPRMSTSASVTMDPIAVARWIDVVLVVAAAPFVVLMGPAGARLRRRGRRDGWSPADRVRDRTPCEGIAEHPHPDGPDAVQLTRTRVVRRPGHPRRRPRRGPRGRPDGRAARSSSRSRSTSSPTSPSVRWRGAPRTHEHDAASSCSAWVACTC